MNANGRHHECLLGACVIRMVAICRAHSSCLPNGISAKKRIGRIDFVFNRRCLHVLPSRWIASGGGSLECTGLGRFVVFSLQCRRQVMAGRCPGNACLFDSCGTAARMGFGTHYIFQFASLRNEQHRFHRLHLVLGH